MLETTRSNGTRRCRSPPGLRPDAGPRRVRGRGSLAGRRGRRTSGSTPTAATPCVDRAQPSRRGARHRASRRRSCSSTRPRCRIPTASGWPSGWRARCPDAAGAGVLLQLGRGGQRERARTWRGRRTGRADHRVARGGWHGRTVAALACTDGAKYEEARPRAGMPLSRKVPFNDVDGARSGGRRPVAAVILEPVQGMPGARDCSTRVPPAARELCDRAWRGADLRRDPVRRRPLRRVHRRGGLRGRRPTRSRWPRGWPPGSRSARSSLISASLTAGSRIGDLGSTFGGGPVPCAAALATLEVIERERLIANAIAVGEHLAPRRARARGARGQGRGLLLGLRLDRPGRRGAAGAVRAADPHRHRHRSRVLRLMPPLSFSPAEADLLLAALEEVLA